MTEANVSPQPAEKQTPQEVFSDTLNSLEKIVEKMESGQLGLEDSVSLFQQGMDLAQRAEKQLREARQKVEILLGGEVTPMASDAEED
ncbi:exodeoxyribonuclease VII small subunit [Acidithiobacillus sp. AMEEHan]|uniref:exodeoxyribonuclease VII small subunit n=1 Tax=Acidithiobacillus sp. AMEEHan TaxID=2994951 RepID=UPI0027E4F5B3|nr:exodeoxyribonuclease VII small subunit [Acidithiobacillus sp. AMEEHan]